MLNRSNVSKAGFFDKYNIIWNKNLYDTINALLIFDLFNLNGPY